MTTPTTIAEWDNEYARLARAASQIRSGLVVATTASAQQGLPAGLARLHASLDALPLQATEIQRRRRLVQHLQETSGSASASANSSGSGNTGMQPQQQQRQQQAQTQMQLAMQQQDAMIDELAAGVGRLKHQTHAIHDEAGMHVNLLNQMEENLDSAQQGLEDETRRAARLKQDQSLWRLQLIVAALSILLVLLILTGITP